MKTLELFCGTKSFSKVADSYGYETLTLDNDKQFNPDLCLDILDFDISMLKGYKPNIIWASPPCETFSIAAISHHWNSHKLDKKATVKQTFADLKISDIKQPKSEAAILGIKKVKKTIEIIKELNPKYFYIENPRATLRKLLAGYWIDETGNIADYDLIPFDRNVISYCQYQPKENYGNVGRKPTDIWTNNIQWLETAKICKNGDHCHESAKRGARTGTQGLDKIQAGSIPPYLFHDIFMNTKRQELRKTANKQDSPTIYL